MLSTGTSHYRLGGNKRWQGGLLREAASFSEALPHVQPLRMGQLLGGRKGCFHRPERLWGFTVLSRICVYLHVPMHLPGSHSFATVPLP